MYQEVSVRNFRGIDSLTIKNLRRVNLLVGPNNVGKTSLLEAIWLLQVPGNPGLTGWLAVYRGFNVLTLTPDVLWHPLFGDFSASEAIEIAATCRDGTREALQITLSHEWVEPVGAASENGAAQPNLPIGDPAALTPETLIYKSSVDGAPPVVSTISMGFGRTSGRPNPEIGRRAGIFLPARYGANPDELADRFTKVEDIGAVEQLREPLAQLQPGITDISIGFRQQGRQPVLRAHIAGKKRPIPFAFLGEGVSRLLDVLLAVQASQGGIVLVDEIENGLYYRNLESAWRAIDTASGATQTQVFATTHSRECVEAAVAAFGGDHASDFALHRLERVDGALRAVTYDHETALTAIELSLEYR